MAARDVRKNINAFIDGRGYAGQVEEFNAPKLALKTEEYRGGGMNAAVELTMGMETMTADFSLISYSRDTLALFGVAEGRDVNFIFREALESFDGTVTGVTHVLRGKIKEIDPGTSKPGEPGSLKHTVALNYYKLQHGDVVVQEIDVVNMVHIVNGEDLMAAQRLALGM
jgi:uncharacterized protein